MKLSEQLKQDHECGDFGSALNGYADRAAALELDSERYRHVLEHGMPHQGGNCCWYLDGKRFSTAEEAIDAAMLKTPNISS